MSVLTSGTAQILICVRFERQVWYRH